MVTGQVLKSSPLKSIGSTVYFCFEKFREKTTSAAHQKTKPKTGTSFNNLRKLVNSRFILKPTSKQDRRKPRRMYITLPKPLKPAGTSLCSFVEPRVTVRRQDGGPAVNPSWCLRTTPGLGAGRVSLGPGPPPHRLLDRVCDFSWPPRFPRFPGGERRAWTLGLYG